MGVIYYIQNTTNNKMYVGSATNFVKRKSIHLSQLNLNKHHSIVLQRAWNKYGSACFVFGILEDVLDNSQLLVKEQKHLDTLKPKYNIAKIAGSRTGTKCKKSNVDKLNKINSKPIKQYNLEGKFLKRWKSITETSKILNINYSSISRCCHGTQKISNGFMFKFAHNPKPYKGKASIARFTKEERSKQLVKRLSKIYTFSSPEGAPIKIENLKKFSIENNLTLTRMYAVANGREESHKGYRLCE